MTATDPQAEPPADDDASPPRPPDAPTRPPPDGSMPTGNFVSMSDVRLSAVFDPEPDAQIAPDPLLGMVIGGVRLVRVIGQGGMGKVYEGEQLKPRFTVAVKVMRPGLATPAMRKRFEYEAEILARLRHPGIAQIFSAGVESILGVPVPYFVMEYIPEARTLTDYAEGLKLPTRARLDLFRSVCEAVAHGHQKGVVHRDLKPANILVDATGQPKVIDFGVAKATDSDLALTTMHSDVGQLIGTLQYMGPEQLDGDPNEIDTRCDVYALGVVLYELLTGRLPYDVRQKAVLEVMRIVKEEEPTPISALDKTLRRDVAVIAGKCLEKDRARRYSSASELGADVARHLAGEPIQASPPSFIDGLLRLARKHRAAAAATVGIAASLMAAVAGISVFAVRAERARETADKSRQAALDFLHNATRPEEVHPIGPFGLSEDLLKTLKKLEAYHDECVRLEDHGRNAVSLDDLHRRGGYFSSLGDLALATRDYERARGNFDKALAITETVAAQDPHNARCQRDLATIHGKLGNLAQATGDLGRAREHLQKFVAIMETRAAREWSNDWQWDLAKSHNMLGDLARATGDLGRARGHFQKCVAIMERRRASARQAPLNRGLYAFGKRAYYSLGRVAMAQEAWAEARDALVKGVEWADLIPEWPGRSYEFAGVLELLAECHRKLGDEAVAEACEKQLEELKEAARRSEKDPAREDSRD